MALQLSVRIADPSDAAANAAAISALLYEFNNTRHV
jgi:hypothetical protein